MLYAPSRQCTVDGCSTRPRNHAELCSKHAHRERLHGNPLLIATAHTGPHLDHREPAVQRAVSGLADAILAAKALPVLADVLQTPVKPVSAPLWPRQRPTPSPAGRSPGWDAAPGPAPEPEPRGRIDTWLVCGDVPDYILDGCAQWITVERLWSTCGTRLPADASTADAEDRYAAWKRTYHDALGRFAMAIIGDGADQSDIEVLKSHRVYLYVVRNDRLWPDL